MNGRPGKPTVGSVCASAQGFGGAMRGNSCLAGLVAATVCLCSLRGVSAQPAAPPDAERLRSQLRELDRRVDQLRAAAEKSRDRHAQRWVADVAVYSKAVSWILRHDEFYKPVYVKQAQAALKTGIARAHLLQAGEHPWNLQTGTSIRGYLSRVDGSVQPYALTLPANVDPKSGKRWPLYVKLHGRAGQMNEVNFIARHDGKPLPSGQTWIQLDVFGRTNNAYRWSGETDVFEALADVERRFRIDGRRVTLHGFSMGGAGAWHLGLHHPTRWSSVGPGAGFVDFYKYQNQTQKRPPYQHRTLGIYDALDYALNAHNVPVCTYGGELDKQLVASTSMVDAARKLKVPITLLIGPKMGHKFHPDSLREFMKFHADASVRGRPRSPGRRDLRFVTRTLKYNTCGWLTIEEMLEQYVPASVESRVGDDGVLQLTTANVATLQLARGVSHRVEIDGDLLPLENAADGLLPGVYYERGEKQWYVMDYMQSKLFPDNRDRRKRRDLQGPIDDAFMGPFVCVRGTGKPWSAAHQQWSNWTLARFEREFDKWLRGRVPVVDDTQVSPQMIQDKHLVLFGDPGSNQVLARLVNDLPLKWDESSLTIDGKRYGTADHGLALIFPNPLNPRKYVVLNSGHTFHEPDFQASNSWLFPRLGDVAVQKFVADAAGSFQETVVWAEIFNGGWFLPGARPAP